MTQPLRLSHHTGSTHQRLYASLLSLGACILLLRTIAMMAEGSMSVLMPWVSALLVAESLVDVTTLLASVRWWMTGAERAASFPLRAGAAAAILHAVRVLIFVIGRTGPWADFDVRPEHRALHVERWTWGEVYFAAVLSALGVLGGVVIWAYRRRGRRDHLNRFGRRDGGRVTG